MLTDYWPSLIAAEYSLNRVLLQLPTPDLISASDYLLALFTLALFIRSIS